MLISPAEIHPCNRHGESDTKYGYVQQMCLKFYIPTMLDVSSTTTEISNSFATYSNARAKSIITAGTLLRRGLNSRRPLSICSISIGNDLSRLKSVRNGWFLIIMIGNPANGSWPSKRSPGNCSLTKHALWEAPGSMKRVMWSSCFQIFDNSTAKLQSRLKTGRVLAWYDVVFTYREGGSVFPS